MKFIRPAMEIEAMAIRDLKGTVTSYCCDFLDGKQTRMLTAEELSSQGFRLLNGHDPSKPIKKRKKAAPLVLSEEERRREQFLGGEQWTEEERQKLTDGYNPMCGNQVQPAQEYDHQ